MKTISKHLGFAFFILAITLITSCFSTSKEQKKASENTLETTQLSNQITANSLAELLVSLKLQKKDIHLSIDKSDYTLQVVTDTSVVKTYSVVFGTNPIADKLMQGDRATPEGTFKVRASYPHKSWSKFIWIDYPTEDSWKKHNAAKAENRIPKDAKIGGEIGIHGVPNHNSSLISNKQNWTWGCISLTNQDVNDLYEIVYDGMKIEITK